MNQETDASSEGMAIGFQDYFLPIKDNSKLVNIHYIEWNTQSSLECKHLVVMLHGSYQTCHTFDDFVEEFNKISSNTSVQFLAMDLRGHGDSFQTPNEYTMEGFVSDLKSFLKQYLTNKSHYEKISLIGMSLGGLILMTTFLKPNKDEDEQFESICEKICNMSIIDISPEQIPVYEKETLTQNEGASNVTKQVKSTQSFDSFEDFLNWAQIYNPRRSRENLKKRLQYSLKMDEVTRKWTWKYDVTFSIDNVSKNSEINLKQALWNQLDEFSQSKRNENLSISIVRGNQSNVTTREQLERLQMVLSKNHSCNLIEIENAGHSVLGDNPVQFIKEYYFERISGQGISKM